MRYYLSIIFLVYAVVAILSGCGQTGGSGGQSSSYFDPSLPAGVISFEAMPAATSEIDYIIPLGNINPPDHTIPSNHIYFVKKSSTIEVHAPASGKVLNVNLQNASYNVYGIIVGVSSTDAYYMYHVVLNPVLSKGDKITAGQVLGTPDPTAAAFDLGVVRSNVVNTFGNSNHYMEDSINGDSPLKYFVEPFKSQLYALVRRSGSDKDGSFCYDQSGKLIGNWFQDWLPNNSLVQGVQYGSYEASFIYDVTDPTQIRIAIGGNVGDHIYPGQYYVQDGAKDPATVTPSDGKITYKLFTSSDKSDRAGLLIVEMLSNQSIKIDRTSASGIDSMDFTSNAKIYTR